MKELRKSLSNIAYTQTQKDNGLVSFSENAYFLYHKLLEPYIKDKKTTDLIIIPDEELNRIPFETLIYEERATQDTSFQSLNYLANKYTIRYAYSTQLLLDAQQAGTTTANNILAFAASYDPSKTNDVVRGKLISLDGVQQEVKGLQESFQGQFYLGEEAYAGTPSLIMSLWQVSDFSTAQIMQRFYQNLAKGQNKSTALRHAKFDYLELMKDKKDLFSHPFFWGAFISLGDDRNVTIQLPHNYNAWIIGGVGFLCILLLIYFCRRR